MVKPALLPILIFLRIRIVNFLPIILNVLFIGQRFISILQFDGFISWLLVVVPALVVFGFDGIYQPLLLRLILNSYPSIVS